MRERDEARGGGSAGCPRRRCEVLGWGGPADPRSPRRKRTSAGGDARESARRGRDRIMTRGTSQEEFHPSAQKIYLEKSRSEWEELRAGGRGERRRGRVHRRFAASERAEQPRRGWEGEGQKRVANVCVQGSGCAVAQVTSREDAGLREEPLTRPIYSPGRFTRPVWSPRGPVDVTGAWAFDISQFLFFVFLFSHYCSRSLFFPG